MNRPRIETPMIKRNFSLEPELNEKIKALAKMTRMPADAKIREILWEFMEAYEKDVFGGPL